MNNFTEDNKQKVILEKATELMLLLDNCNDESFIDTVVEAISNNNMSLIEELGENYL
ncbi:MAG: hypothetical protein IJ341_02235 [Bacteroidales bacterium]|nr:hypothetical protein [Bacteroidales bacterium]